MTTDIAVIILTYNEEANIGQALQSVRGWAREVYVVDSYSVDATLAIAGEFGARVFQNAFEDYASQRNWALKQLPIDAEWVFFLDADEWLPQKLKGEISEVLSSRPKENGFYVNRRFIWMGRWIRRGYYPCWLLRLFRRGKGLYECRSLNEHPIVDPPIEYLKNDFIHDDHRDLSYWIAKHNIYALKEAQELFRPVGNGQIAASFWGTQPERRRWLRYNLYNRIPPMIRPVFYFVYRYFLLGGFLEGKPGFIFHFLHALWFPVLIDSKFLELKGDYKSGSRSAVGSIHVEDR